MNATEKIGSPGGLWLRCHLTEEPPHRVTWPKLVTRCVLGLIVALGLIFCHGCHAGDHDDELLVWPLDR